MKPFFTLAALAYLAAASLPAQAQFTVDGKADAAEISTTAAVGKYQLVGTYTGTHLDADRGLKALYVGYTATTLNIMVVGSGESATAGAYRAFIVYLNTPARSGAPAGTQLPGGLDTGSPLAQRPTLDLEADYGFRTVVSPTGINEVYSSAVSYVTGMGTSPVGTDPYIGLGNKTGTPITATTAVLTGARIAYSNSLTLTTNTTNTGVEIEIPLSALGGTAVAAGSRLDVFAAYTDSNGGFVTTDVIPAVTGATAAFGSNPNFFTLPGRQAVGYVLGTGVLASRDAVANGLNFHVYPNPATSSAKVAYTVPAGRQAVSLAVYNALGQRVRALADTEQAGNQEFALGTLPAGAYLVKLQVGGKLTSRKVVVQ